MLRLRSLIIFAGILSLVCQCTEADSKEACDFSPSHISIDIGANEGDKVTTLSCNNNENDKHFQVRDGKDWFEVKDKVGLFLKKNAIDVPETLTSITVKRSVTEYTLSIEIVSGISTETATATTLPSTGITSSMETTSPQQSMDTTSPQQPMETTSSQQPMETTSSIEPLETISSAKPMETTTASLSSIKTIAAKDDTSSTTEIFTKSEVDFDTTVLPKSDKPYTADRDRIRDGLTKIRKLKGNLTADGKNLTKEEITAITKTFLDKMNTLLDQRIWADTPESHANLTLLSVVTELEGFQKSLVGARKFSEPLKIITAKLSTIVQSFKTVKTFGVKVQSSQNASYSVLFPPNYSQDGSPINVALTQYDGSVMSRYIRANLSMVTDVISVVTLPRPPHRLDQPIELTFQTQDTNEEKENLLHCTFLDLNTSQWDDEGCQLYGRNSSHVTCHCYHLTNFAILMQVVYVEIPGDAYRALETLTVVGSSASLTAIGLTIIILVWLRYFTDRLLIMINLMIALGLAQTVFLTGVNATYNWILCRTVAVMLHYLYLCVFSLMLVEGIQLFQKLYRAMSDGLRIGRLLIAAWVVPIAVVAISVAIRSEDYGTSMSCWLSMNNGTIWAFVGPALFVITINAVILGLVLRMYVTVRINAKKTQVAKIRSSIKAAFVLLPLIGLTWVFGIMTVSSDTIVFQYIFALLNSLQGFFIFVFHVAFNDDVRASLKKKTERLSKSRTWFSSTSSTTSKVYFMKRNVVSPILECTEDTKEPRSAKP